MGFNRDVLRHRRDKMHEWGVRVRWAGRRPKLWKSVINELEEAVDLTKNNSTCTLMMCVNYGCRAELVDATREIALQVAAGEINPEKIIVKTIQVHLDEPKVSDGYLFLRSSGARRT